MSPQRSWRVGFPRLRRTHSEGSPVEGRSSAEPSTKRVPRRYLGAFLAMTTLFGIMPAEMAAADGGDFTSTFRGAHPASYDHLTGAGGVFGNVVTQLNGGDFDCGDRVVFLTRIAVDGSPTDPTQAVQLNFSFGTQATGQDGAGYRSLVSASANTGDPAHTADGGSAVDVVTQSFPVDGSDAQVSVQVTDLEANESFILRLVLELGCDPGESPTGTIHAALDSAAVISPTPDAISGGQQTTPLMQAGLIGQPTIDITKTADSAVVSAGDAIGFSIVVSNLGNVAATSVVVTDALPGNAGLDWSLSPDVTGCSITGALGAEQLECNLGTLAAAGSITIHVTSPTTAASCGTVPNSAAVTTGNNGTDQASASIEVQCPDVTVIKDATPDIVTAPGTATFTIVATNSGQGIARNVTLTDTLPAGTWTEDSASCSIALGVLSCSFGDLAPGASSPTVTLTRPVDTCAQLPNTAIVSAANEPLSAQGNNSSSATVTVTCALLSIAKVADDPSVSAGDQVGFTITVVNGGDADATNVVVTDDLPGNLGLNWSLAEPVTGCAITGAVGSQVLDCTLPTVPANDGTVTIHVISPTTPATCGTITNRAGLATGDPALATVTVNCPDVRVIKTADNSPINAGDTAAFTIVVTNLGPGTATGVTLNDSLPAGIAWSEDSGDCSIGGSTLSCIFGTLDPGETHTIHVTGATDAADCGSISNTAIIAAVNEAVGAGGNNSATASIRIVCPVYGSDPSTLPTERPYDPAPGDQPAGNTDQPLADPGSQVAGTTAPVTPAVPSEDSGNPVAEAVIDAVESQVNLPRTGGELIQQAVAGLVLVGIGLVLLAVRRRRSSSTLA